MVQDLCVAREGPGGRAARPTGRPWAQRPLPSRPGEPIATWRGEPATLVELTALRVELRACLRGPGSPVTEDELEWLLLVLEELASNGLRHGRPPVTVAVTVSADGWLVVVTDAAPDLPPAPAVDRDAAYGGLGLPLVSRLTVERGWVVDGSCKHVWARGGRASGGAG